MQHQDQKRHPKQEPDQKQKQAHPIIRDIMRTLKVSETTANEVYDNFQIDLSECSQREFNDHARFIYETMREQDVA
jgi:muramidase (phage lysozyme)